MFIIKTRIKGAVIMRTDFHSHILPCMDDGSRSVRESAAMLGSLADSGVERVVLTPHFYRKNENIESFLRRRQESFEKLSGDIGGAYLPQMILGAEVYFYPSLSEDPDFGKLCIGNTDYILLELPFERFYDNFYAQFMSFINRCEHRIILAHAERYLNFGNTVEDIERLCSCGRIICQMNCDSIAEAGLLKRRRLLGMIESGLISVLGTDAHNLDSRPPRYGDAEKLIRKKCGDEVFERLCSVSEDILSVRSAK